MSYQKFRQANPFVNLPPLPPIEGVTDEYIAYLEANRQLRGPFAQAWVDALIAAQNESERRRKETYVSPYIDCPFCQEMWCKCKDQKDGQPCGATGL